MARTCTYVSLSMTSWTTNAVTRGFFVPATITSGELMVGLVVRVGPAATSYMSTQIMNGAGEGWSLTKIPKLYNWTV